MEKQVETGLLDEQSRLLNSGTRLSEMSGEELSRYAARATRQGTERTGVIQPILAGLPV
jgi:hypothetical protein